VLCCVVLCCVVLCCVVLCCVVLCSVYVCARVDIAKVTLCDWQREAPVVGHGVECFVNDHDRLVD